MIVPTRKYDFLEEKMIFLEEKMVVAGASEDDGMTLILSRVRPWVRSVQRGLSALEGEHQEIGRQANNGHKYAFNSKWY